MNKLSAWLCSAAECLAAAKMGAVAGASTRHEGLAIRKLWVLPGFLVVVLAACSNPTPLATATVSPTPAPTATPLPTPDLQATVEALAQRRVEEILAPR